MNSTAVSSAPTSASLHSMMASGNTLYIAPNTSTNTAPEITSSMICQAIVLPGTSNWMRPLSRNDTTSRNAMPISKANACARVRNHAPTAAPGLARTPHTRFKVPCNCANTADAPNSVTTKPTSPAMLPACGRSFAFAITAFTASAARAPSTPLSVSTSFRSQPLCSSDNAQINSTSSGAIDSAE